MTAEAAAKESLTTEVLDISVAGWAALARYLQAQLDESRAVVARVLHDELGGVLVAAKIDLGHLERALYGRGPELTARATQAQQGLDHAIATGRRLVESLQPGILVHIGLIAAVRWYLDTLRGPNDTPVGATLPETEIPVPLWRREGLYRAIQEAADYVCDAASGPVSVAISASTETITVSLAPFALPPQPFSDPRLLAIQHRLLSLRGTTVVLLSEGSEGRSAQLVIEAPIAGPAL